ncbi:bola-like protein [Amylostereum chailletii]|nr:bola-like protein [Amylostereum chailletii]
MTTSSASFAVKPVETAIQSKLESLLQPSELKITNDSWQHRHHAPMRAQDGGSGETHFSVQVVSQAFAGKSTMQRHRMIYSALSEEFQNGLHALSLTTKTQEEMTRLAGDP